MPRLRYLCPLIALLFAVFLSGSPEAASQTLRYSIVSNGQKAGNEVDILGENGHIKDPGHPLEHIGKVVKGKQKAVIDGPYAEAKDVIGGFTVIEAKDLAQATELSKGCPILDVGGSVEVRPIQKF